jgi:uncharacterized glyoxalase superfamily protein PhnB
MTDQPRLGRSGQGPGRVRVEPITKRSGTSERAALARVSRRCGLLARMYNFDPAERTGYAQARARSVDLLRLTSGQAVLDVAFGTGRNFPLLGRHPSRRVLRGTWFHETFRTPKDGAPVHVEIALDGFTVGIASVDAAIADHGLRPKLGGRPAEIVLWTDNTDRDSDRLSAGGATSLSPPHDCLSDLPVAWVSDPDGNPIQLVERRRVWDP